MNNIQVHPDVPQLMANFKLEQTTNLGFGKYFSPIMITAKYAKGQWESFNLEPYAPIPLDPCAKVLHYAQEIFEGMKTFRKADGELVMFRPEMNARRFNMSARRMAMPEVPEQLYLEACEAICAYSKSIVPSNHGESLYLRPFMIATEAGLGIKPATEFLFVIIASPSGGYFSGDSVKVYVERKDIRCAPGGMGYAKTGGNYAASLNSYKKTLDIGCDQTMWLDALEHKYIEEMSGMNFFAIINGALHTPTLTDTILDGITRKSIIDLARLEGYEVFERKLAVNEVLEAVANGSCTEAFMCGTAAVIAPVKSFLDKGKIFELPIIADGGISMKLRTKLIDIQCGLHPAPQGWLYPIGNIEK